MPPNAGVKEHEDVMISIRPSNTTTAHNPAPFWRHPLHGRALDKLPARITNVRPCKPHTLNQWRTFERIENAPIKHGSIKSSL